MPSHVGIGPLRPPLPHPSRYCLCRFASSRTGRVSSLSFWLSLLSETVLPRLFDVGAQESLSDNPPVSSVSGFVPLCPQSIQVVLVQWLRTLVDVESSCAVVFGHEKFAPYLREICRQSFFLPATRASQIEQTISIYRHWIRVGGPRCSMRRLTRRVCIGTLYPSLCGG